MSCEGYRGFSMVFDSFEGVSVVGFLGLCEGFRGVSVGFLI